ncbi:MAG TPA: DUF4340 domain-containing protein [Polyangiaceae bacterium]|nr:DUF4340 domain-containing protein [Polyangiaceae bacterium]
MSIMKGLILHLGLFVTAVILAVFVWNKEDSPIRDERLQVSVWAGSPAGIKAVRYESDTVNVELAARKDDQGAWYIGKVERFSKANANPHAGVPNAPKMEDKGKDPKSDKPVSTKTFIAVKSAEELLGKLAPLQAYRAVGKIDKQREAEFGFENPQGKLHVDLDGRKHTLIIGSTTPGGADRYAKVAASGEVYAIPGDIVDMLVSADARLVERDLHGFEMKEADRVVIQKGDKRREIVRVPEKEDGWADAATPSKLDETAGNWMTKVDRLRISEYVDKPAKPIQQEDVVARIEYFDGQKRLGYLELVNPGKDAGHFLVRTEQSRWYAEVPKSMGEQVEQDLPSVLK